MESALRDQRAKDWFSKWHKPIRSWLRNRASVPPGDVADLASEVFLRVLRYSDSIEVENQQGYLFRIAANVANEWRERSRNCKPHDSDWLDGLEVDTEFEPVAIHEAADQKRKVEAAYARLPPRQRHILLLHLNEELTYKQIAARERLTYRIVLRDLTRAYAQLRTDLREYDEPNNDDRRSGRTHPPKAASAQPVPGLAAAVVAESDVG